VIWMARDWMVPEAALMRVVRPQADIRLGAKTRRRPFHEAPWVLGRDVDGPRAGTLLLAPTVRQVQAIRAKWPDTPLVIVQSLDVGLDESDTSVLPRLIPAPFFPPGEGADLFGLTRRLHLEERPRLVCFGDHQSGPALTAVLESVQALFASGGELVFWNAIAWRDRLAPVIKHLRLTEHVVFAPALEIAELSALFLGADAMILMERQPAAARLALTWAMASGNPIVAVHSPENEALLGPGALWVYDANPEVLYAALKEVLSKESVREELAQRQAAITKPWHAMTALPYWQSELPT
jgi:hypothetical protein